ARVLFYASHYFNDNIFMKMSRQMVENVMPYFTRSPSYFSGWASVYLLFKKGLEEIVLTGPQWKKMRKDFTGIYFPSVLFAGAKEKGSLSLFQNRFVKGENRVYVCRNSTCKQPVATVKEALKQLSGLSSPS
ncbi:MAG TPA: hypothetical protein VE870_08680, partial [Bacteroidales bacterium]|nr:hypothetical protein [Bacteroidales bacterium]